MNEKEIDKKKKGKKEDKEILAIEAEYKANKDKVITMLVERIMDVKIEFP